MSLTEITLIAFVALILFGPEDLPVVARTLGKIMWQVRRYTSELSKEFQNALETPTNVINQALKDTPAEQKIIQSNNRLEDSGELLKYDDETKISIEVSDKKTDF